MFKFKREKNNNPFLIKSNKFGKLIGFSYRKEWTEDSYISDIGANETVGKTFNIAKTKIFSVALLSLIFILVGRVAWLQVVNGEYYYTMAEGNRIRIERIESKRGVIYDKEMRPLVRNVANFSLYITPIDLPQETEKKNEIFGLVSNILGEITKEDIESLMAQVEIGSLESYQPLFIIDNIEYEKAMKIYLESQYIPGVKILNKTRREYELDSLSLSHIMGYTGKIDAEELETLGDDYSMIDYVGKMGLEYFWENELKGKSGKKQIEVDALGKEKKIINEIKPEDGYNLVLSLDADLQKKIEEIANEYFKDKEASRASIIVMNPNNGEINALVSLPSYDNNIFARGITQEEYSEISGNSDNPLYNRSISGEYPSGSTFKPVMAAAALQEGIISEWTTFNSVGGIRIDKWFFPDWKSGGHGITNVRKAIAQSVNTFFYYIGGGYEDFTGLGVDKIVNYAKMFGLGEQTGIDLPGEAEGFLPSKEWKERVKNERWYIGDTYHLSIGQGDILVTPLQVANYTSVFANGGKLYRPHLVTKILDSNDNLIQEVENIPINENFIDDYNILVVLQGMRQTVTSGSAQSLQAIPVEVAGKTGTAQWSSKSEPHAWFTGFAPYDNPEMVITVLIEEGGDGSYEAVPIAREILNWYFAQEDKQKSLHKTGAP